MYPVDYDLPLNLTRCMFSREITVTGSFLSPYAFPRAAQWLR